MSVAVASPSADPTPPYRRFSVAEYQQMIQVGILTDEDKVELLDGYVVLKMPRNPVHDARIQKLTRLLFVALPLRWDLRVQLAITLAESQPEPDIALVRGVAEDYETRHPVADNVGLVVEVSDSSLLRDRDEKAPIYAAARIPEYWIVNLVDHVIEVYSNPAGSGALAGYVVSKVYRPGDSLALILDGATVGQLAVRDILP